MPEKRQITTSTLVTLLGRELTPRHLHSTRVALRNGAQLIANKKDGRYDYFIVADTRDLIDEALDFVDDSDRVRRELDFTKSTWQEQQKKALKSRLGDIIARAKQNRVRVPMF